MHKGFISIDSTTLQWISDY